MRKTLALVLCLCLILGAVPAFSHAEGANYKEAPALTARAEKGEIPALAERLPEDPMVITPKDGVGQYGGTWRQSVTQGTKNHACHSIGYYGAKALVVWNEDKSEIVPNLASSYEISEDAKTFTFTLRKGLKWSDGQPLTMDDVEFWFNGFRKNTEINPDQSEWTGVELKKVDDYTFQLVYPTPQPLLMSKFSYNDESYFFLPKHYMAQFHPDYAAEGELDANLTKYGLSDWVRLFKDRMDGQINPEFPMMGPWILKTDAATSNQLIFERNPYYWAVDTEGNQLPYIDTCIINIVESADVAKMKAIAGEFDLAFACIQENFSDYPLFAEHAEEQNYTINTSPFDEPNGMNIHFNITNRNESIRKVTEQANFRKAMSLGLNRADIIATFWTVGPYASDPSQSSTYPGSPYYDEDWVKEFTDFDAETANKMLDELGMTNYDADGYRLAPDGNPFALVISVPNYADEWIDIGEMLAKQWRENVKVNITANSIDPSLWNERCDANDFDMSIHTGGSAWATYSLTELNNWAYYRGFGWSSRFMSGNYMWRNDPSQEGAVEPLPEIKRLWELGFAIIEEVDEAKREEMRKEIFQIHKDNLFVLGIGTRLPAIWLLKNYMHNVWPLDQSWSFGFTGHARPEQYWIDQSQVA